MRKVMIGVPSMGSVKTFTVTSLLGLVGYDKTPKMFSFPNHTYVHEARRICVEEALENGCSHLFFIDSDMAFMPNVLEKLASHRKMVVGANYHARKFPLESTIKFREDGVTVPKDGKDFPKQLFKCYAVPTGMMLIDLRVFEKLPKPWFNFTYKEDGTMDYGEDVYFCDLVQKAGYDVWCDPTIDVRHIGDFGY